MSRDGASTQERESFTRGGGDNTQLMPHVSSHVRSGGLPQELLLHIYGIYTVVWCNSGGVVMAVKLRGLSASVYFVSVPTL